MKEKKCVIIGASHAGVNCAFELRNSGWSGEITLIDADPMLPYHRPPLSKTYLKTDEDGQTLLRDKESYQIDNINLKLGVAVKAIEKQDRTVILEDGFSFGYDKLVFATGARPFFPPIKGLENVTNLFTMRTAQDAIGIRNAFKEIPNKKIIIIGGGYIGLETAASLKKLGGEVVVLEREERILSRVTSPVISDYFIELHTNNGVDILTGKDVVSIDSDGRKNEISCADGSRYTAEIIIVGVGIRVNQELAAGIGLKLENGIKVNAFTQTNDPDIYAIGDCSFHHNPHYDQWVRLESVQNAVDQAKIAAASICGNQIVYDSIPWFWSDQYDTKLQIVGLFNQANETIVRQEADKSNCFSVWYFKDDELLAVDAINNGKAFILGTKFIKEGVKVDKIKLADASIQFKPNNLIKE